MYGRILLPSAPVRLAFASLEERSRKNILGSMIRQGFKIVGVGLAIGMAGAIGLTRLIQSMLYGVSGTDPVALLTAVGVLGLAAFLACMVPAFRATRIDPITALRE